MPPDRNHFASDQYDDPVVPFSQQWNSASLFPTDNFGSAQPLNTIHPPMSLTSAASSAALLLGQGSRVPALSVDPRLSGHPSATPSTVASAPPEGHTTNWPAQHHTNHTSLSLPIPNSYLQQGTERRQYLTASQTPVRQGRSPMDDFALNPTFTSLGATGNALLDASGPFDPAVAYMISRGGYGNPASPYSEASSYGGPAQPTQYSPSTQPLPDNSTNTQVNLGNSSGVSTLNLDILGPFGSMGLGDVAAASNTAEAAQPHLTSPVELSPLSAEWDGMSVPEFPGMTSGPSDMAAFGVAGPSNYNRVPANNALVPRTTAQSAPLALRYSREDDFHASQSFNSNSYASGMPFNGAEVLSAHSSGYLQVPGEVPDTIHPPPRLQIPYEPSSSGVSAYSPLSPSASPFSPAESPMWPTNAMTSEAPSDVESPRASGCRHHGRRRPYDRPVDAGFPNVGGANFCKGGRKDRESKMKPIYSAIFKHMTHVVAKHFNIPGRNGAKAAAIAKVVKTILVKTFRNQPKDRVELVKEMVSHVNPGEEIVAPLNGEGSKISLQEANTEGYRKYAANRLGHILSKNDEFENVGAQQWKVSDNPEETHHHRAGGFNRTGDEEKDDGL